MNVAWLNTIGLVLVAAGIILGIVRPNIRAVWVGDETARREWRLGLRYYLSIALVVVGTLLQLFATWPVLHSLPEFGYGWERVHLAPH